MLEPGGDSVEGKNTLRPKKNRHLVFFVWSDQQAKATEERSENIAMVLVRVVVAW